MRHVHLRHAHGQDESWTPGRQRIFCGSVFSAHSLGTYGIPEPLPPGSTYAWLAGDSNVWSSVCLAHSHGACGDEPGPSLVLGESKWIHCRSAGADAIQDARASMA